MGALSGVDLQLLERAFEAFKEHTICHHAEFVMHLQSVKIRCNLCAQENELQEHQYICPDYKSQNVEVIDGEDMYLMQLELDSSID